MNFEITLPSGLIIEAADLHGREVVQIAERVGGNASGETLAAFLTACCKRVVDAGPYPFVQPGDGSPNWKRMLWGDLLYAIITLRIQSFPEHKGVCDFEFSCPHCKALSGGSIDLAELLTDPDHFHPLPQKSQETLLAQRNFVTETPSGQKVHFDLGRVEQDEPMRVLMKREQRRKETDVEVIAKRVKSVDGLKTGKGEPITDLRGLWRWAMTLSMNDMDAILAAFEDADILVDMKILAWCTNPDTDCGRQSRIPLPLDTSFFRPRSGTKRGAMARRARLDTSSPESPANGGSS